MVVCELKIKDRKGYAKKTAQGVPDIVKDSTLLSRTLSSHLVKSSRVGVKLKFHAWSSAYINHSDGRLRIKAPSLQLMLGKNVTILLTVTRPSFKSA